MTDRMDRMAKTLAGTAILLSSLLSASGVAAQRAESPAARIARDNLPAVVTVVALDSRDQPLSLGSGFFISRAGVVATNAHVVEGASRVLVRWRGQTGSAEQILNFDPKYDLITLQTSFPSTPTVVLGDSDALTIGEDIIALGSPQGLEGTVSTGIVSGIRDLDGIRFLQITAPISPGSSGGPIFNIRGQVVGIATATMAKGQNLNFALASNLLRTLPLSAISFAAARHSPPNTTTNFRELITITKVIEEYDRSVGATYDPSLGPGWLSDTLGTLTVSILNKSDYTIGDPVLLVILRARTGEILNFHLNQLKSVVIPPGLAKQVSLTAHAKGYGEFRGREFLRGSYEIRILDFRIVSRGGNVFERLFEQK